MDGSIPDHALGLALRRGIWRFKGTGSHSCVLLDVGEMRRPLEVTAHCRLMHFGNVLPQDLLEVRKDIL